MSFHLKSLNMRKEPDLNRFGENLGTLRSNEKSFFNTLFAFTPYWDYKPTNAVHADSPVVFTSDKLSNSSTWIKST